MSRKRPSKGLGDTIDKITTATGIKAGVKFLLGEDCGCDERKEKLNKLFPYKQVKCLDEQDYIRLNTFFVKGWETKTLRPTEVLLIVQIYNRTFNTTAEVTSCGSCLLGYCNELKRVYDEYKNDIN